MDLCITHGWSHYEGETDSVTTVGDDLDCRTEQWDNVVSGEVIGSQCERLTDEEAGAFILSTGNLGYLDTFTGLVPVKVTAITATTATVRITAGRPGYERGEELQMRIPNMTLINRTQVFRSQGRLQVRGPLRYYTDEGDLL